MTEELRHCPACGGEAQVIEPVKGMFMACCFECGLHYRTFTCKHEAVSDWNNHVLEVQLKSCPFCDNPANLIKGNRLSVDYWYVACSRCLGQTRSVNSPDEAVRLWNKRKEND